MSLKRILTTYADAIVWAVLFALGMLWWTGGRDVGLVLLLAFAGGVSFHVVWRLKQAALRAAKRVR